MVTETVGILFRELYTTLFKEVVLVVTHHKNGFYGTCEVKIDAGGYPYISCDIELYDYDKDQPLAQKGDKVKILVIKE
jgi:hypothetical protein